ncbi:MAG: sulfotransferase [Verrucomicrobiae bacterium]|nr:sulfotransferase [Verrucomicrobiae bacterium]
MKVTSRIAIHGVPRSGTTWLGEIFNSSPRTIYRYQPLFSWAFKHYLGTESDDPTITRFFEEIAESDDAFLCQEEKRESGSLPRFEKSPDADCVVYKEVRYHHILFRLARSAVDLKLVLLVRSPFAVIHSWLRAPREFRGDLGWKPEEEWRYALRKNLNRPEEFNGFEKWKEATTSFTALAEAFPERVILVEYRELLAEPETVARKLLEFCGLDFQSQTKHFLRDSREKRGEKEDPYGVFRSHRRQDDGWHGKLDPGIVDAITSDLEGTSLARYLY